MFRSNKRLHKMPVSTKIHLLAECNNSVFVNWTIRASVQARLRVKIKKLLSLLLFTKSVVTRRLGLAMIINLLVVNNISTEGYKDACALLISCTILTLV